MSETRRIQKKVQRCVALLGKHEKEVVVAAAPTKMLYVANAGVVCGVSLDELHTLFAQYGLVKAIHVFPNSKPYAFVVYDSEDGALKAMCSLHATHPEGLQKHDVILYLVYVNNLPDRCCVDKSTLTENEPKHPPGLYLTPNFVTEQEETELWDFVRNVGDPQQSCDGSTLKHRVVHHFGYTFDYSTSHALEHSVARPAPIPECCTPLIERFMQTGLIQHRPDQLTVNLYEPGQGIASHTDTHSAFEDCIVSLSLLSDVVMEFKSDGSCTDVLLPARSLCVMTGRARYVYKHGMAARKYDVSARDGRLLARAVRCSFTFRAVRRLPCECEYASSCDRPRSDADDGDMPSMPSTDHEAQLLERTFVENVYNNIAGHFDQTRHSQWRGIAAFLDSLAPGSTLLDVGCGNGKYLWASDGRPLIRQRRLRAIQQLVDVLGVGGRVLVTVWAYEQHRQGKDSSYLNWGKQQAIANTHGETSLPLAAACATGQADEKYSMNVETSSKLPVHTNLTAFKQQDVLVPWVNKSNTEGGLNEKHLRFYHVFKEGELELLCKALIGCRLVTVTYEQGNWCALLEKTRD